MNVIKRLALKAIFTKEQRVVIWNALQYSFYRYDKSGNTKRAIRVGKVIDSVDSVFHDNEKEYFVKRVIGLPGEKVDILNGTVYITGADGKTLELRDDFVSQENKDNYSGSFVVPEDCYFVMGDNRDNSVDSRYWVTTNYVSRDKFIGKVMFRYYPFKTAGKLE